jgi:hypothetical protein
MKDVKNVKIILGKTIKGVIVKMNSESANPRMSMHLVFSDNTSYEIYSQGYFQFTRGLMGGGMVDARTYMASKNGVMENIFDESLDDE